MEETAHNLAIITICLKIMITSETTYNCGYSIKDTVLDLSEAKQPWLIIAVINRMHMHLVYKKL